MEDENRNVEKGDLNEDESIYVHKHEKSIVKRFFASVLSNLSVF